MWIGEVGKGCRVFAWKCLFEKLWLGEIEMENENIFLDETRGHEGRIKAHFRHLEIPTMLKYAFSDVL